MSSRLAPLLQPRSISIVGASEREGSVGRKTLEQLQTFGFEGDIWPVNPNYEVVLGLPCFQDVTALPAAPDNAVLCVPNAALEQAFAAAIAKGAQSATIFASGLIEGDTAPPLNERLKRIALAAGIPVCGSNGMGFYNFADRIAVCGFAGAQRKIDGGITLITHSGSVVSALADCEDRLGYALVVSTGNEIVTGLADYMNFALDQDHTTAIGLFMETARQPLDFLAALEAAAERNVPVIVLKVGRTRESARLAISHSGALAGNDAAYRAVFERTGAILVDTLDEMAATLMLMTAPRRPGKGGLATMHDSGGERGLWLDRAASLGVPYSKISDDTRRALRATLEFGLAPENPLDAWGTGRDFERVFADGLTALAADPETALTYFAFDREEGGRLAPGYAKAALATFERTHKPVAIVTSRRGSGSDPSELDYVRRGIPVIDGEENALRATKHAFAYRDFRDLPAIIPPAAPRPGVVARWSARFAALAPLDESAALHFLADIGLPAVAHQKVRTREEAIAAAISLGLPVALKSAAPGLAHKSDAGGVRLDLASAKQVGEAYDAIAARLGPEMLIAVMAPKGTEIALGMVNDADFGPLIMIGAGGTLIDVLDDKVFLLSPFDAETAARAIARLRIAKVLAGVRGAPAGDGSTLASIAARLSVVAVAFRDRLAEIDINPLIVLPEGCVAVDALLVARPTA